MENLAVKEEHESPKDPKDPKNPKGNPKGNLRDIHKWFYFYLKILSRY